MTLLSLVILIFVIGAIVSLARYSGWVAEPFLDIGTKVAVAGVVLLILYFVLAWTGTLDTLRTMRIGP